MFEGLGDIVVGASFKSLHHVLGIALGGEHNNRHIRRGTNLFTHLNTVLAGEHQIKKHQVGAVPHKHFEGAGPVFAELGVIPFLG